MSMVTCFQAMGKYPVLPIVRVPWLEPGIIGKVLDGGAWGLICPMINTAAQCADLVQFAKYPPVGARSNGPIRFTNYGAPSNYQSIANDEVIILPMIETREAIANLEAILDTPGITGVYIGPSDLGFSHGLVPKLDREEPEMLAIFDRIIAECSKRGLVAGIQCNDASYAVRAAAMGFKMVTLANDISMMSFTAMRDVATVRKALG
jgi:4-hydroxy-2-oxoheptanedioate aldolase